MSRASKTGQAGAEIEITDEMISMDHANPVLDHAWGLSPGADRVWAQIAGIAPSREPWKRLFMVLKAYMDESYAGRSFVLAGYIATAEEWARFSVKWDALLPVMGRRGKNGRFRFKMSEMRANPERVRAFYHVIEEHALVSLSCQIDLSDVDRLGNGIIVPGVTIDWGFLKNPYLIDFRCLLDMFHTARFQLADHPVFQLLPKDEVVDFYFDDHVSKKPILAAWDSYIATREVDVKKFYGALPRFENDEIFLPLQAADFLAWWIRRGYNEKTIDAVRCCDFGEWKGTRLIPGAHISFSEDQMTTVFRQFLRERLDPADDIYRVRSSVGDQGGSNPLAKAISA